MKQRSISCAICLSIGAIFPLQGAVSSVGFEVDTSQRNQVLALWNQVYRASDGFESRLAWTGAYGGTCNPGAVSAAFESDVERRINFYRAMAGISASVLVNEGSRVVIEATDTYKPAAATTKQAAAQNAALMFSYAGQLNHTPPPATPFSCWTQAAWNAAKNSNLALGLYGPDAVDGYMRENDLLSLSTWSDTVGHRRWLLMLGLTNVGSGDVPGGSGFRSSNVLYVLPGPVGLERYTPKFVAWPPAGYFPDELMPSQWSLSYPGADFSSASVEMRDSAGQLLALTVVDGSNSDQGDPTLIWTIPAPLVVTSVSDDVAYSIVVEGIKVGGKSVAHSYQVTITDPDRLNESMNLVGTSNPPVSGANYHFGAVPENEGYRLIVLKNGPANWTEGAESAQYIMDSSGASYSLRGAHQYGNQGGSFRRSGAFSFRMSFPSPTEHGPQSFEIDREITAESGSKIRYYTRRGYITQYELLKLQISKDGVNWVTLTSLPGTSGVAISDASFVQRSAIVPDGFGSFKIRFELTHTPGMAINYVAQGSQYPTGVFIDDITITDATWVTSSNSTPYPSGAEVVRLDDAAAGEALIDGAEYGLRIAANLGGRDYFSMLTMPVVIGSKLGGYDLWQDADYPMIGGFDDDDDGDGLANGVEYGLYTDPMKPSFPPPMTMNAVTSRLSMQWPAEGMRGDLAYQIEWSENLAEWFTTGSSVSDGAGVIEGSVPMGSEQRFLRWNLSQP